MRELQSYSGFKCSLLGINFSKLSCNHDHLYTKQLQEGIRFHHFAGNSEFSKI